MKKSAIATLPILCFLLLWQFISTSGVINPALFPPPSKVIAALYGMIIDGTIIGDVWSSMWRILVGLIIGSSIGICIGLLTGSSNLFRNIASPILQLFRPLPLVAIIPLIIVWLGIGNGAKLFSIAFAVFFPVWIQTDTGVRHVQKTFIWVGKLLQKTKREIVTSILFPASLPFIISGIRTGIAVAFVMAFVSELAGASSGLGYRISITSLAYRIDQMMAALFVLGLLGALTDQLFVFATRKIFPWTKFNTK